MVSTTTQRVIDSSHFFSQGFFGIEAKDIIYSTTADFDDPVPWLAPWERCPKLSYVEGNEVNFMWSVCQAVLLMVAYVQAARQWAERYTQPIIKRLDKLIPDVGFSVDDVRGALYACPYDLAARNKSPWCNVFTARELRGLE